MEYKLNNIPDGIVDSGQIVYLCAGRSNTGFSLLHALEPCPVVLEIMKTWTSSIVAVPIGKRGKKLSRHIELYGNYHGQRMFSTMEECVTAYKEFLERVVEKGETNLKYYETKLEEIRTKLKEYN